MITGKYIFKQDGQIIAEKENIVTANGLNMINQYLTGQVGAWAGQLAIGALGTTTASTDTYLSYEIDRYPINVRLYDASAKQIVLKSQLPPELISTVYEIGIFPTYNRGYAVSRHNFIITNFDEMYGTSASSLWRNTGATLGSYLTPNSVNTRTASISIPVATTSAVAIILQSNINLSLFNNRTVDSLNLLYFVPASATTVNSTSVTVTFSDTLGNLWTSPAASVALSASGYYAASVALSSTPATGFNYNLSTIRLAFTGGTANQIYLDSLRTINGDLQTQYDKLVSRASSSATPILNKYYGQKVDVEYHISVTY